jgi:diguanylate cyclase (GGDEF)-like protein
MRARARHMSVLVLSQDPHVQAVLARRVRRAGYQVITGTACQGMIRQRAPLVAVVWHLAGTPNARLTAQLTHLHRLHADAVVILIGPDRGAESTAALLRTGAFDYLTWPVRPGRLEQALKEGLTIRRSLVGVRALARRLREANAELERERDSLKRWNRNLVLLNELGQALAGSLEADEIVRLAGDRLGQMVGLDSLMVLWQEPRRVWGYAVTEPGCRLLERTRKRLLCGEVSGHALEAQGPFGSDQTSTSPSPPVQRLDLPLVVGGTHLGVMYLERISHTPFETAQQVALTDGLTTLLNRRAFTVMLTRAFKEAERYRTPLCLIMVDVDHFKSINDRFGHVVGDRLLKELALVISASIRTADVAARYGGEEFAVILPRTDLPHAQMLAHRLRDRVRAHVFDIPGSRIILTVSLGIAQVPHPAIATAEDLVAAADRALYEAKARGRDRIVVYPMEGNQVPPCADRIGEPGCCKPHQLTEVSRCRIHA